MKANEAPEKIYVQLPSRNWIGKTWDETPIEEGDNPNWKNATNIEYIRKNTFIEKALAFIRSCTTYDGLGYKAKCVNIEEFKKYMEGE